MALRLPIYADQPEQRQTIALDGVQYQYRLIYRERRASWYLDLYAEDGAPIALGRRLSPGWSMTVGVPDGPGGALVAIGYDPYPRDGVELWYITAVELAAAPPSDDQVLPVEVA
ncbi:MAG TPA: hypothetical protein VFW27_15335 [Actinoplanes sp.]|nr:hypothetical protein [Actinoplanes sp.]